MKSYLAELAAHAASLRAQDAVKQAQAPAERDRRTSLDDRLKHLLGTIPPEIPEAPGDSVRRPERIVTHGLANAPDRAQGRNTLLPVGEKVMNLVDRPGLRDEVVDQASDLLGEAATIETFRLGDSERADQRLDQLVLGDLDPQ